MTTGAESKKCKLIQEPSRKAIAQEIAERSDKGRGELDQFSLSSFCRDRICFSSEAISSFSWFSFILS